VNNIHNKRRQKICRVATDEEAYEVATGFKHPINCQNKQMTPTV